MESIQRIEELIHRIDSAADPSMRAAAHELVQALMDFHSAGIERMMEVVFEAGDAGAPIIGAFGRDPAISGVLLLYDLHPDDTEVRVRRAVDKMRNVNLVSTVGGVIKVNVNGSGHHGRPARAEIEAAIYSAAPEVVSVEIAGLISSDFVPLDKLMSA